MGSSITCYDNLTAITQKLINYCRHNEWAGYDPYDILNSDILKRLFFLNSRLPRLSLTQLMKRSPFNFRRILGVPKTQNPKSLALFLMALQKLAKLRIIQDDSLLKIIIDRITALRSRNTPYFSWGYSFPWQTRTHIVPRGTPNLVCTVFVANALLDVYEETREARCLAMAKDAAEFIIEHLYWTNSEGRVGFAYPLPSFRTVTINANLLGAALLCRVSFHTGEKKLIIPALNVAHLSASLQNPDGSWYYGELPSQRWVDNFHTGYNLLALRDINRYCGMTEFNKPIQRGVEFYVNNFFLDNGAPKYFHNKTYPIDIHAVAQSLITLRSFADLDNKYLDLALSVLKWAYAHMWDERGFFYYQVFPAYTNHISYMRWSQAWMLLALSSLLEVITKPGDKLEDRMG